MLRGVIQEVTDVLVLVCGDGVGFCAAPDLDQEEDLPDVRTRARDLVCDVRELVDVRPHHGGVDLDCQPCIGQRLNRLEGIHVVARNAAHPVMGRGQSTVQADRDRLDSTGNNLVDHRGGQGRRDRR